MKYRQLGNGGGLNPLSTNSSFLIEIAFDEYLLFDCGFNIMEALIKEQEDETSSFHISQIKHVFISHIHDDHVGNVETLMYWNYFKNNVKLRFYYGNSEVENFYESKLKNCLLSGCEEIYTVIYVTREVQRKYAFNLGNRDLYALVSTYHGPTISTGLVIREDDKVLIITGDTKASTQLMNEIHNQLHSSDEIDKYKIFHDFSNWNAPSKNVHACQNEIDVEYTPEFISELTYYHTDEEFDDFWQTL